MAILGHLVAILGRLAAILGNHVSCVHVLFSEVASMTNSFLKCSIWPLMAILGNYWSFYGHFGSFAGHCRSFGGHFGYFWIKRKTSCLVK